MKPWEKYAQSAPQTAQEGDGPWTRYKGSAEFEAAVDRVLGHEGGYANDPDDRGGETNYGISKRAHPDVDVASLTAGQARQIYRQDYWEAINADSLPDDVREMAFDAAVNHGVGWTKAALQEVGNDVDKLYQKRKKLYQALAKEDPSQEKFLDGWMNRLESYVPRRPWLKYGGGQ